MFERLVSKFTGKPAEPMLCPVCGSSTVYPAAAGNIAMWQQQLAAHGEWLEHRGLEPGTAPLIPGAWKLPAFDELPADSIRGEAHTRCTSCRSLLPGEFVNWRSKRVLMITTGMPGAGKTTWLRCLLEPRNRRYLIAEPTAQIQRTPYRFVEPYTVANVDARSAFPFLLHGLTLSFQDLQIPIAGVDIKGEIFRDRRDMPDKFNRVDDILRNLRRMTFDELFLLFVVPFTGGGTARDIGELTAILNNPPSAKRMWQGIIWTHLDRARLRDETELRQFVDGNAEATALIDAVLGERNPFDDAEWSAGLTALTGAVREVLEWDRRTALLESLTWVLFRLMLAYARQRKVNSIGKVEFYFEYGEGLGGKMVEACVALAATLFAAWDNIGRGDFAAMVLEALRDPHARNVFHVLPCGFALPAGADPQSIDPATLWEDGLPVWGDLLLLEILNERS